jgi:hypothetical protein
MNPSDVCCRLVSKNNENIKTPLQSHLTEVYSLQIPRDTDRSCC